MRFISIGSSYNKVDVKDVQLNEDNINQDKCINKLKGLLYGFYIGGLLSKGEAWVKAEKTLKDFQNNVSAVISSLDFRPTENQAVVIKTFLSQQKKELALLHKKQVDALDPDKDASFSDKIFYYVADCQKRNQSLQEFARNISNIKDNKEKEFCLNWIQNLKNTTQPTSCFKILPKENPFVCRGGKLEEINLKLNKENLKLFLEEVNKVFLSSQFNGYVNSEKEKISDEVARCAKDLFGEKWTGSKQREYLNAIRHCVVGQGSIDDWSDLVLSSIAAVLMKGDSMDSLYDFMISMGLLDYRLVFGLYGALNGFANLTRDFTNVLYSAKPEEKIYLADVYKDCYFQIFNEKIPGTEESDSKNTDSSKIVESKAATDNMQSERNDNLTECTVPEELKKLFEFDDFIKLKEIAKNYYKEKVLEKWNGKLDKSYLEYLSQVPFVEGTKTKWPKIVKNFKRSIEKSPKDNKLF
jgi:hypothetical protein